MSIIEGTEFNNCKFDFWSMGSFCSQFVINILYVDFVFQVATWHVVELIIEEFWGKMQQIPATKVSNNYRKK